MAGLATARRPAIAFIALALAAVFPVAGGTLALSDAEGGIGSTVELTVTAGETPAVAGASFCVVYPPGGLEFQDAFSSFFAPFTDQYSDIAPAPSSPVSVSGQDYGSPFVVSGDSGRLNVVGARRVPAIPAEALLVLRFRVLAVGEHQVSLEAVTVGDTDAGYSEDGEPLPYLYGSDPMSRDPAAAGAFTAIAVTVTHGTVGSPILDRDGDDLSDIWEQTHFGDLDQTAAGDPDGDGLSNEQEQNLGTAPDRIDTDNDGMPDKWELDNNLLPTAGDGQNGPDGDPDKDEYTNLEEFLGNAAADDQNDIPTAQDWGAELLVSVKPLDSDDPFTPAARLSFGMQPQGTDGFDPGTDQPAPAAGIRIHFVDPSTQVTLSRDFRGPGGQAEWHVRIEIPARHEALLQWSRGAAPPQIAVSVRETGPAWQGGSRETRPFNRGSIAFTNEAEWASETFLVLQAVRQVPESFSLTARAGQWSLVSVPVLPANTDLEEAIPEHIIAWKWDPEARTYVRTRRVTAKDGFWLLVDADVITDIAGVPYHDRSVSLKPGWNLVGVASLEDLFAPASGEGWGWDAERGVFKKPTDYAPGQAFWFWVDRDIQIWEE